MTNIGKQASGTNTMNMELKMRAHCGRGRWKVLSAAKSPNKGRVQEEFLQPPSLLRRTSKHFFPDLKSSHKLNPSALFSPTQKADPGKAELAHRIAPPHPSRVNLALRIFVSVFIKFFFTVYPPIWVALFLSLFRASSP